MSSVAVENILLTQEWQDWHREHERRRAAPHGFLAVTSINWLGTAPQRFPDAPGEWTTSPDDGPVVELAAGETLVIDGDIVSGRFAFGPIPERGGVTAFTGPEDRADTAAIEVARRGGNDIVRPHHPGYTIRAEYRGTTAFPVDPDWRIVGHYLPFVEPQEVTVGSVAEGLTHVYAAPGVIEFERAGATHRLTAFNGFTPTSLHVLFTDETSGVTTYAANRSLTIEAPDADGRVVIDFNRATNLPCAYTPFATCPLPPAGNRLPIAVTAGEKAPA